MKRSVKMPSAGAALSAALLLSSPMPAMAALLRSCPPGAPDVCLTLGVPSEASAAGSGNLYMQIRAPLDYQWVAFGTGGRMLNSNMFIVYQDGQGNVTISPRRGTFHTPPQLDTSATAAQLTLLEGSGVDEANGIYVANIVCANCNSWNGGTMSLGSRSAAWIGAWRRGDPLNSPSPSTQIVEHDGTVSFTVDLTRAVIQDDANPFLAAGSGGGSDGTGTGNGGRISDDDDDDDDDDNGRGSDGVTFTDDGDDDDMLLAAHGLLMAIVFVVAYPLGAALMPLLGRWWLHGGWQAIVFVAMWAGFGLGIQLAIDEDQLFKNTHTILGLCVCIFFALQVPLGLLHHRHFRRHGERGLVSYAHIWYGRAVMILGIVNGGLGLQLARPDNGLVVAYAVTAAVMGVFYGCAAVLGAIRRRRAAKHAVSSARRNKGAEGSSVSDRDQGGMSPRH